jgi:hypothetical protein
VKGKGTVKKFNDKCFIRNKIEYLTKDFRNKGYQGNPKIRIVQPNVTEVDHLTSEVLEMNMSCVVFEVNLIKNLEQW